MFMQIAIGAIGIGIILMIGYIVVSQVRSALPDATTIQVNNDCYGLVGTDLTSGTTCVNTSLETYTAATCGTTNLTAYNSTAIVNCPNVGYTSGTSAVQVTVFAGFGLIAVGIIVLAAFGLINIFR